MPFTSCGGCLKNIFITEAEIIDRYVGNQLWLWGNGSNGALGNNSTINRSSPVQTVSGGTNWKEVNGGHADSILGGIKTDGTLWMWGIGSNGALGNNSTINRSSPVQTVSAGTNWKQMSLGFCHGAAIKTDGTLWLWGINLSGRLGDHTTAAKSSPVQTISGGTNWKQVSLGSGHSAAIKTDGTLWLWGQAGSGQLGDNTGIVRSSPVQTVSGGTNWKQVAGGNCHTAAIKTDGTLWLWGDATVGQLGNNSLTNISSPVQTVSGGTNWKQVYAHRCNTAAIKTDGTLWTWGLNNSGQLGDNTTVSRSSPVQTVSGGTNWKQVSVGQVHLGAIKTDGSLWLWGNGGQGILGTNDTVSRSSPVQTVSGGTNWKQVSLGFNNSAAVTYTES
jgi:alpha-tubulin suppressor-like RCC1 family protein